MLITRPILAASIEENQLNDIRYPIIVNPKIDGIRCLVFIPYSRKLKPIPNKYVKDLMARYNLPDGLDGELLICNASFNEIQSAIMSEDYIVNEKMLEYWVFDWVWSSETKTMPYIQRIERLQQFIEQNKHIKWLKIVKPQLVFSVDELINMEKLYLENGYEGIMIRDVNGPYKEGRSTLKEQFLIKFKRFQTSEAAIIGFEELMHNCNEAEKNELGYTKRSLKKEGLKPANTLGAFIVKEIGDTPWQNQIFRISSGENLTHEMRQEIWENQSKYLGKVVTYKYQHYNSLNLPRFPVGLVLGKTKGVYYEKR